MLVKCGSLERGNSVCQCPINAAVIGHMGKVRFGPFGPWAKRSVSWVCDLVSEHNSEKT
jgi:hypothetical protein